MRFLFSSDGTSRRIPVTVTKAKNVLPLQDSYATLQFSAQTYLFMRYGIVASEHNCASISPTVRASIIKDLNGIPLVENSRYSNGEKEIMGSYFLLPKYKSIVHLSPLYSSLKDNYNMTVFHPNDACSSALIDHLNIFYVTPIAEVENKISLIVSGASGLTTQKYNIKMGDIDVPLYYGQEFVPVYEKVLSQLNQEESKGLVLFHGEPGAGKTSIIKYISKQLKKEVIFVPPNMGDSLCSPSIVPFLLNHKNSILVIEDAERIISDRDNKMFSEGVSSILNITDGILGDCLNIQIICTFNTERDKIDKALLRKGRLIAEHKFTKLDVGASNKLFSHLGKTHTTNTPLSLAEIFNYEEAEFITGKKESVGFKIAV